MKCVSFEFLPVLSTLSWEFWLNMYLAFVVEGGQFEKLGSLYSEVPPHTSQNGHH